jgi:hypothetical protein
MPMAQAQACNARIHDFNAYNNRIAAQVKAALADRDRIVREEQAKIQRLNREKQAAQRTASMLTTCDQEDIMARKACLDKLFDNQTVTSGLDVVEVPDLFGGRKWTVQEVIQRYKESGDATPSQIMKLYKSIDKINVPSPGH